MPLELPNSDAAWIALGERVFFEYPVHADPNLELVARLDGGLRQVGFHFVQGEVLGLRVFANEQGVARVGPSCAQCHSSVDDSGVVTAVLANRAMDVGAARLMAAGHTSGELPPEIDSTLLKDLARLGPGRTDVLQDDLFNPFAIPDFGGIADFPYLQHNGNWLNTGVATLAIRCETLFITSLGEQARIPRVLSWALAMYLRSLPAPAPLDSPPSNLAAAGEQVFNASGCGTCHTPPLYTSDRRVSIETIGTDPAALSSSARRTGFVRIPSLRGVGRTAPYFHHGAIEDLEMLFDPARTEAGHRFGFDLGADDRAALIAFLRSI